MEKHKIFVWNNGGPAGFMEAVAIGDDGNVLAGHVCSDEYFMKGDMGVTSTYKHDKYNAHFGEGNWEIEWVPSNEIHTHPGLIKAIELNNQQPEEI